MPKEPVNIVVCYSYELNSELSKENQDRIKSVSSRIKLSDITLLLQAEKRGDTGATEHLNSVLTQAEVFCGFPLVKNLITRAPKLKWIQSAVAGIDQFMSPELIASPVILTKAAIHDQQISEMVLSLMLMLARHSFEYFRAQQDHKRIRIQPTVLHSTTVGILGLGNIGEAVARKAKALGMKVIATKGHPGTGAKNVDKLCGPGGLLEVMKQSDFVVILLPITKETRNLIGETELRAMKPTAYLINVARGSIVNQEAIIRALKEKWIAGAGLDVLATDPNPPADEVYDIPNLILTPHIAGQRKDYSEVLTKYFCLNLRRYLRGKDLLSIVDKKSGY